MLPTMARDYQTLADVIAGFAHRNEPITPLYARHLAAVLLDLADRAKHLEAATLQITEEPDVGY